MRTISFIAVGMISASCIFGAHAKEIKDPYAALECPKLSLEQALQVVKSGKMIDAMPHWVAFAQAATQSGDLSQAVTVDLNKPIEDNDGNVICEYVLRDASNKTVAELALRPNYGVNEEPSER